jgi:cobyrinic acid a,c-diamide synthase
LIIAAPSSGSGKTTVTLGLLAALRESGVKVASAKVGPDYIDPRFHETATDLPCYNIDGWAMNDSLIRALLGSLEAELIMIEGVMGLFDGPEQGKGSTADIAAALSLPVVLVIDAEGQSQSAAATVRGFATHREDVKVAGVIFNKVRSERHGHMLNDAIGALGIPVLGHVYRETELHLPGRHLGLVQADEHEALPKFIRAAAATMKSSIDLAMLHRLASPVHTTHDRIPITPLGQRIAIARDAAFAFAYPHFLQAWRQAGSELSFFSPLADEAPAEADAIFLPGGYPELHAGRLAAAGTFLSALRNTDALVYGECGGFMVLGDYLIDAEGHRHGMAGLLPLGTSFATRRLHLGYRELSQNGALPFPRTLHGHEFHYSTIDFQGEADWLFQAADACGRDLGQIGLRRGRVMGSYAHVIA